MQCYLNMLVAYNKGFTCICLYWPCAPGSHGAGWGVGGESGGTPLCSGPCPPGQPIPLKYRDIQHTGIMTRQRISRLLLEENSWLKCGRIHIIVRVYYGTCNMLICCSERGRVINTAKIFPPLSHCFIILCCNIRMITNNFNF